MKKLVNFSVAFMTTTLLCLSCQKEDVVARMDVTPTKSENVQKGKTAHVSYKDAIQIATEAVAMLEGGVTTRSGVKRRVDLSKVKYHVTPQTRSGEGGDTLYYVVNYADNAGFALVSTSRADGDPLIAVTEQGNFTPGEETGNPGFDMYIDLLNSRIDDGRPGIDPEFPGFGPFYETVVYEDSAVSPLLAVRWGQGSPYNRYCNNGYAGCVAVAIAQIMSYYQYPTSFIRTHDDSNITQTLNWAGLKSTPYAENCTPNDKNAIAHFIREIGKTVRMRYYTHGSYAFIDSVKMYMPDWGYSPNMTIEDYDFSLVMSELDNNRPVYMRGLNPSSEGHAWVVDGYRSHWSETTEYYETGMGGDRIISNVTASLYNHLHINWGYDGQCNGYYASRVFDMNNPVQLDTGVGLVNPPPLVMKQIWK